MRRLQFFFVVSPILITGCDQIAQVSDAAIVDSHKNEAGALALGSCVNKVLQRVNMSTARGAVDWFDSGKTAENMNEVKSKARQEVQLLREKMIDFGVSRSGVANLEAIGERAADAIAENQIPELDFNTNVNFDPNDKDSIFTKVAIVCGNQTPN